MNIAILLDGDFTRRLLQRKSGHQPSASEIENLCTSVLQPDENIYRCFFYDCPPFDEDRPLPVSKQSFDFMTTRIFSVATSFQKGLRQNQFFTIRSGHLSFDGWRLKDSTLTKQMTAPLPLQDSDFEPVLTQKQVDIKIGLDVAKLSMNNTVERILLATSDADFIPAIQFARSKKVDVVLLSDITAVRRTKASLLKAFSSHRII